MVENNTNGCCKFDSIECVYALVTQTDDPLLVNKSIVTERHANCKKGVCLVPVDPEGSNG
jgi:hypothetical protein